MKTCIILTLLVIAVTQTLCDENIWMPVFVGFAGNSKEVYNTWRDTAVNDNILKQYAVTGKQTHLRNGFIDHWTNVKMVKVELLDSNNNQLVWLTFNGKGTTNTNWFSKANLMGSSYNDLVHSTCGTMNYFSVEGELRTNATGNTILDRRFFINRSYAGCDKDYGWFVVADTYSACAWEQKGSLPLFLYTDNNASDRNWTQAKTASTLVISVSTL